MAHVRFYSYSTPNLDLLPASPTPGIQRGPIASIDSNEGVFLPRNPILSVSIVLQHTRNRSTRIYCRRFLTTSSSRTPRVLKVSSRICFLNFFRASLLIRRLLGRLLVNENPRNVRFHTRPTALLASFTFSLSFRLKNLAILANTLSAARLLFT